jgi:hypothetical protein
MPRFELANSPSRHARVLNRDVHEVESGQRVIPQRSSERRWLMRPKPSRR